MLDFVKSFSCIYWGDFFFLFQFVNIVNYINWFSNISPSWHFWVNPIWSWWIILLCIVVFTLLEFWLNFCIYVYDTYWSVVCFLGMSLSRFGIRVMLVSQNELGSIPSFSIFWRILYKIGNFSSFNVWENSPVKASGSEVFCGKIWNYKFNLYSR